VGASLTVFFKEAPLMISYFLNLWEIS